jgi:hypothetical protein
MWLIRYVAKCTACGAEKTVMELHLDWETARSFGVSVPPGWSEDHHGRLYCPAHLVVLRCEVDGRLVTT